MIDWRMIDDAFLCKDCIKRAEGILMYVLVYAIFNQHQAQ